MRIQKNCKSWHHVKSVYFYLFSLVKTAEQTSDIRVVEFSIVNKGKIRYIFSNLVSFVEILQTFHMCGFRIYLGLRGFWLGIRAMLRYLCFVCEILANLMQRMQKLSGETLKFWKKSVATIGWLLDTVCLSKGVLTMMDFFHTFNFDGW